MLGDKCVCLVRAFFAYIHYTHTHTHHTSHIIIKGQDTWGCVNIGIVCSQRCRESSPYQQFYRHSSCAGFVYGVVYIIIVKYIIILFQLLPTSRYKDKRFLSTNIRIADPLLLFTLYMIQPVACGTCRTRVAADATKFKGLKIV